MLIKIGSKGDLVQEIQSKLAENGFDPGPIDGVFGQKTWDAVIKFQESKKLDADGIVGPNTLEAMAIDVKAYEPEEERRQFKTLIMKNPNYFGTFPEMGLKPVKIMKFNTKYEEIRCIGFYPEQDLLEAVIDVKLHYGYKGDLCSQGSFEYIRFFVDWNGDGDFNDPDEDVGIASVNVHDIPNKKGPCLTRTKPISYAVTVKTDSKKKRCTIPNLVKVRAILSWDVPPPAGNPNYNPTWGNVLEKWIQIKPAIIFLKDIVEIADLAKLQLEPSMFDLEIPVSKEKLLAKEDLEKMYKGKDVPEHRYNFAELSLSVEKIKQDPNLMAEYKLNPKFSGIVKNVEAIIAQQFNTEYEELHCVGLNYNLDTLVATLTVKLPSGYCGGLCTKGSYEYVAFWINVWDQIEQMCYWKYLGTARVNVHDISTIPPEGLQYAVKLPADLSAFKDKCSNPKLLRVRAILSWQTPPPINNPNYIPTWGNRIDKVIQVKPSIPIKPGEQKPFIWEVGNMAVESIDGNPYTVIPSSIGSGYANGPSVGGGFSALESPFGGVVAISGTITNAPNNPPEAGKLKYKVQYKKIGGTWRDITNGFRIWIRIDGVPSGYIDQVADSGGYYKFQKDLWPPTLVEVQDDILAQWHTRGLPEGDGLYEIRVLLYKPGAPAEPDCPADHVPSSRIKVMIDNTAPNVELTLDTGPCVQFKPGNSLTGKFKAKDDHFYYYHFSILPYPPFTNDKFVHYPVPALDYIYGQNPTYKNPGIPATGITDGTFELDTTGMVPCGYVIYIGVWDRTIVNNYMPGNWNSASVGFCILKE